MADAGAPRDGASYRIERIILAKRARNVAVWAIAFFVAAVPVAIVGGGNHRAIGRHRTLTPGPPAALK